jgi:hypothetical protein
VIGKITRARNKANIPVASVVIQLLLIILIHELYYLWVISAEIDQIELIFPHVRIQYKRLIIFLIAKIPRKYLFQFFE